MILYKKPDAKWASATIDPVYAGTDHSTDRDPVYAGADRSTDGDPVHTGTDPGAERTGSGRPYG